MKSSHLSVLPPIQVHKGQSLIGNKSLSVLF